MNDLNRVVVLRLPDGTKTNRLSARMITAHEFGWALALHGEAPWAEILAADVVVVHDHTSAQVVSGTPRDPSVLAADAEVDTDLGAIVTGEGPSPFP
jgi:hypothetical protein